jgi:uncharacterized protein
MSEPGDRDSSWASPGRPPYGAPPPPQGGPPPYGGPPPHGGPPPYGAPPPYGHGPYPQQQGEDTTWALAAYLGQLAVGFVAPLVVYLARKDDSQFTRFHGAQALNASLTYMIVFVAGLVLGVIAAILGAPVGLVIGLLVILVFAIAHFVFLIIGAVKAGRREMYRLPTWICWRMVR